jgi:hypothetical protein
MQLNRPAVPLTEREEKLNGMFGELMHRRRIAPTTEKSRPISSPFRQTDIRNGLHLSVDVLAR